MKLYPYYFICGEEVARKLKESIEDLKEYKPMIWSATGNKWLDHYIHECANFNSELETEAGYNSPLDAKDREDLKKVITKLNKINGRIYKRLEKIRKLADKPSKGIIKQITKMK